MNVKRSPFQAPRELELSVAPRALDRDRTADVVVIGAGMAGLLTALELSDRGHDVVILERSAVVAGDTGATTAHLTTVLDTRYFALAAMHGAAAARSFATSHMRGIAHLERVSNAYGIDCDFRRVSGFLCATGDSQRVTLASELRAAKDAGISCELVKAAPLPLGDGPALHFPHQAELDPLGFLNGVVQELDRRGVRVHAPVTVQSLDSSVAAEQVTVSTSSGHKVRANFVVVATGTPMNDIVTLHTKQAPYRTYALAAEIPELIHALGWDLDEPYHYVRTGLDAVTQRPVLIVGGEDHKVGQEVDGSQRWQKLEAWLRDRFPQAGAVLSHWSGQVLETSDGAAFIGKNPGQERVYVVTGHSGNGVTYSAIAAELVSDAIDGIENPFQALYDPARKPASLDALGRFVRENLNVAEQYTDWLAPADAARVADIPRGEGAVLRRGLKRIAVYVDPAGFTHEMSASCPHLRGVVAWNSAEKSWDCPCHGSRFDCYGKLLTGPAVSDLERVSVAPMSKSKAG